MDTGAEVNAITESVYKDLTKMHLQKASKILHGPTNQSLQVFGQFTTKLIYGLTSTKQIVFVVRVPFPLREKVRRELDGMEKLGVISKVDEPTLMCGNGRRLQINTPLLKRESFVDYT